MLSLETSFLENLNTAFERPYGLAHLQGALRSQYRKLRSHFSAKGLELGGQGIVLRVCALLSELKE
ncbi:MAG: hypothetical protein ACR2JE_15305 [Acidobacteriaceae bacterium]